MGVAIEVNNATVIYKIRGWRNNTKKDIFLDAGVGGRIQPTRFGSELLAIDNISFSVDQGECIGLIGGNGAGKSTLLKTIAGIFPVNSGSVEVQGVVSSMLSRSLGLDVTATGIENIKLMAACHGIPRDLWGKLIDDVVEFSELGGFMSLPVKTYSAGMRARLSFGLITAIPAEVLLIDEIIGTGDESFRKKAGERFRGIIERSGTVLIASHSKDLLTSYAKKTIWIDRGKVKFIGKTEKALKLYKMEMRARRKKANDVGLLHNVRPVMRTANGATIDEE